MQENIIIGIDASGADEGGDLILRKMDQIKASADSTGRSIDKMATGGGNIKNMGGEVDSFTRSMRNANASVYGQGKAWMGVGNAADMAGVKVKNQAQQVAAAEREHRKMLTALGAVEKQYDRDTHAAKKYADQLDLIAKAQREGRLSPTKAAYYAQKIENARDEPMRSPGGHGSQSGLMREGLTVIRELINGNYTRLAGSLTLLAQYSGAMGRLVDHFRVAATEQEKLSGAVAEGAGKLDIAKIATYGLVAGFAVATVAVAAWLVVISTKAATAIRDFDDRLARLGRSTELSGEQIITFGRRIDSTFGLARGASADMATEFVRNTAIASDQLEATTRAAAALAYTMGGDSKRAATELGSAMGKIATGDVHALDGAFTELDANSRQYIETLIRSGHYTEAQAALNERLSKTIKGPDGAANAWKQLTDAFMENVEEGARHSVIFQTLNKFILDQAAAMREAAAAMRDLTVARKEGEAGNSVTLAMPVAAAVGGRGGQTINSDNVSYFKQRGYNDAQARGFSAGIAAEGGSDGYSSFVNAQGNRAFGVGQDLGGRQKKLFEMFGKNPSHTQQLAFIDYEAHGGDAGMTKAFRAGNQPGATAASVGDAYLRYGMRPGKDLPADLGRMQGALGIKPDPNAPSSSTIAGVRRDGLADASLDPEIKALRDRTTAIAQALIADKHLLPADANRIAAEQARREVNAPRQLEFQRGLSESRFATGLIGQTPEEQRRASALRAAQLSSGGGDVSRSTLSQADQNAVTSNVSTGMEKERQQRLSEMLAGMKEEARIAAVLPQEAERLNALEKARLIINDGMVTGTKILSAEQKKQVEQAVQLKEINKLTASFDVQSRNSKFEAVRLTREIALGQKLHGDELSDEMAIEKAMWPARLAALQTVGNLEDARVKAALDLLEIQVRQTSELEKQAEAQRNAVALAQKYGGRAGQNYADKLALAKDGGDLAAAKKVLPPDVFAALQNGFNNASWELANRFQMDFADAIDTIAGHFGGTMGKVLDGLSTFVKGMNAAATGKGDKSLFGGIAGLADSLLGGSKVKDAYSATSQNQTGSLAKMLGASTQNFKSLGADMRNIFGKNGNFSQGLGSILGRVGAGVQAGDMVNSLAKAIGFKKFSKTGAEIGGAIGSFIPIPGGQFIGAAIGGTVGSLFKKSKYGGASISGKDGAFSVGTAFGNDASGRGAAGVGAANSVMGGLQSIISAIGGSASIGGFGSFNIGQYKKDWRVNTDGGALGGKHVTGHLMSFKTEEEAIAYAMKEAIKKGAIKGLSDASNRVLTGAKDPTTVVSAVAQYEQLASALLKVTDPAKGAIEEFTRGFRTMNDSLKAAGYTAAELGKVEQLYAAQRKELMKQLTAPYRDLIEGITNGPNSGKSIALQYQDAKSKYEGYASASAGTVKSEDFTKAAQSFFDLSQKMFGSTTEQFAADRNSIVAGTNAQIDHVNAVGPPELLNAITTGAAETVNQLTQANTLLARIAEAMGVAGAGSAAGRASLYKLSLSENY